MRTLSFARGEFALGGAAPVEAPDGGLRFPRLPEWALRQASDPLLGVMSRMSAGVVVRLDTDAARLELDVTATGMRYAGGDRRAVSFDLVADGRLVERRSLIDGPTIEIDHRPDPPAITVEPGRRETIVFAGLPAGPKRLELWLPQSAEVELHAVRVDQAAWAEAPRQAAPAWVHYGSSISHGMHAAGPSETWAAIAARTLGLSLVSLGFSGQCVLDGCVAGHIASIPSGLISLKVGVNLVNQDVMRERAFIPALHAFLDRIRSARAATPVIVVSPVACPMHETTPGPTLRDGAAYRTLERPAALAAGALTVGRVRALVAEVVQARAADGDAALFHIDGLELLGLQEAGLLADGLHPGAEGQRLMGRRFADLAARRLAVQAEAGPPAASSNSARTGGSSSISLR